MKKKWPFLAGGILMCFTLLIYVAFDKAESRQTLKQPEVQHVDALPVIESEEHLQTFFKKAIKAANRERNALFGGSKEVREDTASGSAPMEAASEANVSETNVQVQGVDEADLVKTDGTYIYQASENNIMIIKGVPADKMSIHAKIEFDGTFHPAELYLHNNSLVVIGHSYMEPSSHGSSTPHSGRVEIMPMMGEGTKAVIYDISDPASPKKSREILLEGSYSSSRITGGFLYMVTSQHPPIWILEETPEADLRPRYMDSAEDNDLKPVDYTDIRYFPGSPETNYLMIAAVNLEKQDEKAAISTYLGSSGSMYMSKEHLYIGVAEYGVRGPAMLGVPAGNTNTDLYKFSIDGTDVTFQRSVKIPGTILNQFSMDEYNGHFRVATTIGNSWDEAKQSTNTLFIFNEKLEKVGELDQLAKGERIYSARFMKDRIYLVTFKQTDPLFVIDAKDPAAPKVLGELKIPGFSNYLHPYDDNHLIGFGYETKISQHGPGFIRDGVKISVFDVSDVSKPKEKFKEIIGSSSTYSPLNHDHKALLFDKERNLFAFPVHVFERKGQSDLEEEVFQGAYVYHLDMKDGLRLDQRISHLEGKTWGEPWKGHINRVLYIDDHLYALSSGKITSHRFGNFELTGELEIK